jgi:uncharacterized damage-inducible protein DinB
MSDAHLLDHLAAERRHVLRVVQDLPETSLQQILVPSGWTIARLLNHLTYDDEMFWISAVLGGEQRAIDSLCDGWHLTPMSGGEAIELYRSEINRSDAILSSVDLNAAPRWWPPPDVFDASPMRDGREVVFRVLTETAVHAGHLDIVRELIDGRQSVVVT